MMQLSERNEVRMKKVKRVLAFVLAVLLVGMYLAAFVSAFFKTSQAIILFKASLAATVMVPIVIYAYTLVYKGIVERGVGRGDMDNFDEGENGENDVNEEKENADGKNV